MWRAFKSDMCRLNHPSIHPILVMSVITAYLEVDLSVSAFLRISSKRSTQEDAHRHTIVDHGPLPFIFPKVNVGSRSSKTYLSKHMTLSYPIRYDARYALFTLSLHFYLYLTILNHTIDAHVIVISIRQINYNVSQT